MIHFMAMRNIVSASNWKLITFENPKIWKKNN
jgi:hypothetical protein